MMCCYTPREFWLRRHGPFPVAHLDSLVVEDDRVLALREVGIVALAAGVLLPRLGQRLLLHGGLHPGREAGRARLPVVPLL